MHFQTWTGKQEIHHNLTVLFSNYIWYFRLLLIYVYVTVCVTLCVCVCMYVCLSYLYLCMSVSVCMFLLILLFYTHTLDKTIKTVYLLHLKDCILVTLKGILYLKTTSYFFK